METSGGDAGITALLSDLRSGDVTRRRRALTFLAGRRGADLTDRRLVAALEIMRAADSLPQLRSEAAAILNDLARQARSAAPAAARAAAAQAVQNTRAANIQRLAGALKAAAAQPATARPPVSAPPPAAAPRTPTTTRAEPARSEVADTGWTCSLCGLSNAASDLQCAQCSLPRSLSRPHRAIAPVQPPPIQLAPIQVVPPAPMPAQPLPAMPAAAPPAAPGASAADDWACPACGALNDKTERQCRACRWPSASRSEAGAGAAAKGQQAAAGAAQLWACPVCGEPNDRSAGVCGRCGQPRAVSHTSTRAPAAPPQARPKQPPAAGLGSTLQWLAIGAFILMFIWPPGVVFVVIVGMALVVARLMGRVR